MVARNISSILCHTLLGRNMSKRRMSKRSMSFKHDDCQLCEVQAMSVLFHHWTTKVLSGPVVIPH